MITEKVFCGIPCHLQPKSDVNYPDLWKGLLCEPGVEIELVALPETNQFRITHYCPHTDTRRECWGEKKLGDEDEAIKHIEKIKHIVAFYNSPREPIKIFDFECCWSAHDLAYICSLGPNIDISCTYNTVDGDDRWYNINIWMQGDGTDAIVIGSSGGNYPSLQEAISNVSLYFNDEEKNFLIYLLSKIAGEVCQGQGPCHE